MKQALFIFLAFGAIAVAGEHKTYSGHSSDRFTEPSDTTAAILLVTDSTHLSLMARQMRGYMVRGIEHIRVPVIDWRLQDIALPITTPISGVRVVGGMLSTDTYLDEHRQPLERGTIVWLVKELP